MQWATMEKSKISGARMVNLTFAQYSMLLSLFNTYVSSLIVITQQYKA